VHGFYIGRVFAEVKKRPRIIVESTTPLPLAAITEVPSKYATQ
jgi:hypothetical protein